MIIKVNGEDEKVEDRLSIVDLLSLHKIKQIETVSVQRNGAFVDQADYAQTILAPADEIDFLFFLGGGAR